MTLHTVPISREAAHARGFDMVWIHHDHHHRVARSLFSLFPYAKTVEITRPDWNSGIVRYDKVVKPGTILYVKAWNGKRARVYPGAMTMEAA